MTYGNTTLKNAAMRHIPIKISGIYKITNSIDGKFYIGSAYDVRKRLRAHVETLRRGIHNSLHLQRAFSRDGEGMFTFSLIEEVPRDQLYAREQFWLDSTQCYEEGIGYNICRVVGPPPKIIYTPAMRAAISARFKGKIKSEVHRKKIGDAQRGSKRSKEAVENCKRALKEYWSNPVNRAKHSALKKGCIAHNKGKKVSRAVAQEISQRLKEYYSDPKNREPLHGRMLGRAAPNKGVPHTVATRAKIAAHAKSRAETPEGKALLIEQVRKMNSPEAQAKAARTRSAKMTGHSNLKARIYSDEQIAEWKRMRSEGMTLGQISTVTGIGKHAIHYWTRTTI